MLNILNYDTGAGKTLVYLTLLYFSRIPNCKYRLCIPATLVNHVC